MAFAIAIALHEIFASLIPGSNAVHSPQREIVSRVSVARIVARPTPRPTPAPPRTISHAHVIAPVEPHAIASTTTGKSARQEPIHRIAVARPKPPVIHQTKPIWDIPVGGQGAGAGNRSGGGSLGHGNGGNGAGESGSGNGAAGGTQPCGFVTFSDPNGSRYDPPTGGYWVDIEMSVHFPDGRSEALMLDYPWYYRDTATNPWSDRNVGNPGFITTFQFPPPALRASEPGLVRYVMAHTSADGYTSLRVCPAPSR